MRRKIFISIISLFILSHTEAQITGNLIISGRPTANINNWSIAKNVITYIVTNQSPVAGTRRGKLRTELKLLDGTVVATNAASSTKILTIVQGNNVFGGNDVFPADAMQFTGTYKTSIEKTGKLPAGNYQLCITLDSLSLPVPVVPTQCKPIFLASLQLPYLMLPAEDALLNAEIAQSVITFRWAPVSPKPLEIVTYKIQVFEIVQNQTPMQALRSNMPILQKDIKNTTQYIWQPQLDFKTDSLKKFIWTIQTLDAQSRPLTNEGNAEARSEPRIFKIIFKQPGGRVE